MFPPIEPYATGHLRVSDGQQIYFEASGNPRGKPALHLHGGPGGGLKTGYRRRFDPRAYNIVSFEQRGCGRSLPLATDPHAELAINTTHALVQDIEALRAHMDIDRWLVTGVSWGTTLALAYAQAHPARVSELALMAISTTRAHEVAWITDAMGRLFPREWDAFVLASRREPSQRLIDAYSALLTHREPAVRARAVDAWCAWEDAHISLDPNHGPGLSAESASYRAVFATLVVHYWKHAAFLDDDALGAGMSRIARIPGVLIHGRLDVSSPLSTAWELHKAWPASELIVVPNEGHGGEVMVGELVRAIDRFAGV